MRRHLSNAAYGVLDYASYPAAMFLVAPIVLRRLGGAEYGLWIVSASVISAGGILASGCCDVAMQRVARLRGENRIDAARHTVRSLLTINFVCGLLIMIVVWFAAGIIANRISTSRPISVSECLYSIRISGTCILLRAIDSVAVITHRAFEQYRVSVQISVISRILTLTSAAVLASMGFRVVAIVVATGLALLAGVVLQFVRLRDHFGVLPLLPTFDTSEIAVLLRPGVFAWMQSVCGVAFGQLDRILLAVSFDAGALAPYAVCVQFAQPIFGLAASGLHFIFPLISRRSHKLESNSLLQLLAKSVACNLLVVVIPAIGLLAYGNTAIHKWSGGEIREQALAILAPVVLSSALMGMGVTGTYAMQALGRFRTVALLSAGGRIAALLLLICLLPHWGVQGVLLARICFGATALLVYVPLLHYVWRSTPTRRSSSIAAVQMQEKPL